MLVIIQFIIIAVIVIFLFQGQYTAFSRLGHNRSSRLFVCQFFIHNFFSSFFFRSVTALCDLQLILKFVWSQNKKNLHECKRRIACWNFVFGALNDRMSFISPIHCLQCSYDFDWQQMCNELFAERYSPWHSAISYRTTSIVGWFAINSIRWDGVKKTSKRLVDEVIHSCFFLSMSSSSWFLRHTLFVRICQHGVAPHARTNDVHHVYTCNHFCYLNGGRMYVIVCSVNATAIANASQL